MGQLPCLKIETEKVQAVHFAYLKDLMDCGIDGFRYDCVQWFPFKIIEKYIKQPTLSQCTYLEVIERKNIRRIKDYASIAPVIDYSLGEVLVSAFKQDDKFGLNHLKNVEEYIESINVNNVTFAVNHDTFHAEQSKLSLKFDDHSENLATTFLLAIKNGVPLIFRETARDPYVKSAVKFRNLMDGQPAAKFLELCDKKGHLDSKDILMLERGNKGFYILNKKYHNIEGDLTVIGSNLNGVYYDLMNPNRTYQVKKNTIFNIKISSRSANFYVFKEPNENDIFSMQQFPPLGSIKEKN